MEPNVDRDVFVRHVHDSDRWVILLRGEQRAEADSAQRAFTFARLLADLSQSRVWVVHEDDAAPEILDPRSVGGCSCC